MLLGSQVCQRPEQAAEHLHAIWMAETRQAAEEAFNHFVDAYAAKYDNAVACLAKHRKELLISVCAPFA